MLQVELELHPLVLHQFNRRTEVRSKWEWLAIEAAIGGKSWGVPTIPWEEAFARQLHNREEVKQFTTWKEKILPELLPKILPIVATMQRIFNFRQSPDKSALFHIHMLPNVPTLHDVWREVEKTWSNHVCQTAHMPLSNDVVNIWSTTSEPCNLLGSTAKQWLEEFLATSEKWQKLRRELSGWSDTLQEMLFTWEIVYITFHDWHFESSIALITWQMVDEMYLHWKKAMSTSKVRRK
jgi:hypothetical protein